MKDISDRLIKMARSIMADKSPVMKDIGKQLDDILTAEKRVVFNAKDMDMIFNLVGQLDLYLHKNADHIDNPKYLREFIIRIQEYKSAIRKLESAVGDLTKAGYYLATMEPENFPLR